VAAFDWTYVFLRLIGTYYTTDHLEMINWHVRKYTAPFSRVPYKPFNALDFYDRLATFLAQRGH
jgi:hypothetical protein